MMELAQVTQELVHQEQRCHALDAHIRSETAMYRAQSEQGITIESMLEWHARMDAQQAALKEVHQAIRTITEVWNGTQARLVAASQERKIVERLVDRQQQAHLSEVRRREQHATDEAAHRQSFSAEEKRA